MPLLTLLTTATLLLSPVAFPVDRYVLSDLLQLNTNWSNSVAGIYARDASGNFRFVCSGSKVQDPLLERYHIDNSFLTAAHCSPKGRDAITATYYVTFDDGRSFIRVRPVLVGKVNLGYDIAFWLPAAGIDEESFSLVPALPLALRPVELGETVHSFAQPAGLGTVYSPGVVAQEEVQRDLGISTEGYFGTTVNCTGGCSGSPLIDDEGKVLGVLVSGTTRGAFSLVYGVPTLKIRTLLEQKYLYAEALE